MRVIVDREECTNCGVCWEECPEVFEENTDDGSAQIIKTLRVNDNPAKGDIPEDLQESVQSAAEECPAEVIHIQS